MSSHVLLTLPGMSHPWLPPSPTHTCALLHDLRPGSCELTLHNLLSPSALLPTTLSTSATVLMREPVKRRSHKYPFVATGCLGQVSGKLLAAALRANSRRLRSNTVRVTRPRSPGTGQVCCGLLVHCVSSSRKDLHEAGGIITPLSR